MVAVRLTASQAAVSGAGVRPKPVRRTAKEGTYGFEKGHVNQAINLTNGLQWAIEDDCISFMGGVLLRDGDYYRIVAWDGTRYRGATTPRVALEAWKRGMKKRA